MFETSSRHRDVVFPRFHPCTYYLQFHKQTTKVEFSRFILAVSTNSGLYCTKTLTVQVKVNLAYRRQVFFRFFSSFIYNSHLVRQSETLNANIFLIHCYHRWLKVLQRFLAWKGLKRYVIQLTKLNRVAIQTTNWEYWRSGTGGFFSKWNQWLMVLNLPKLD